MRSIVWCLSLFACGVPGGTKLVDLTDKDLEKLCEELEPEDFVCEDGDLKVTITVGADCSEPITGFLPETCEATVDDWRACDGAMRDALSEDPCTSESIPECDTLFACIFTATG